MIGTKVWSENDRKWRCNCGNWVAAKSGFEGFCSALQGLKPLDFADGVVSRLKPRPTKLGAVLFAVIGCDAVFGAKIGRVAAR